MINQKFANVFNGSRNNWKYIIVVLIVVSLVGGGVFWHYYLQIAKDKAVNWKVYRNDLYHFQLKIPSDWRVEETTRSDGFPKAVISSPNNEIVIETALELRARYEETEVTDVPLGKYAVKRVRYIVGQNILDGYIQLRDIPGQENVSISFLIRGDTVNNDILFLEVLRTFEFTQEETGLDELISYIVPSGWKESSTDHTKEIYITSPDYKPFSGSGLVEVGTTIFITRTLVGDRYSLQSWIKEPAAGVSEVKSISIDGQEAVSVYNDFEGHQLVLLILQKPYLWSISVSSPSLQEENKYRAEIDSFISSIKFR